MKRKSHNHLDTTNFQNEPKHGTRWQSHFWDRMQRLVKKQQKSSFTVSFLDRQAVPKMKRKSRNHLDTTNFQNEPKHGTAWQSHFWDPHAALSKKTKRKALSPVSFLGDRKIAKLTAKGDPCNKQKKTTAFS